MIACGSKKVKTKGFEYNHCDILPLERTKSDLFISPWKPLKDNPYIFSTENVLVEAAVIYFEEAFLYFGGLDLQIIARLDSKTFNWSVIGQMFNPKKHHRVLQLQNEFFIVGERNGKYRMGETEKCKFESGSLKCEEQLLPKFPPDERSTESHPTFQPFAVDADYCKLY